jgi:hypothetical protein
MIGFVVQNFSSQTFLIKTQKYNSYVKNENTQLLYLFLKKLIYIRYDLSWNFYLSNNFNSLYKNVFIYSFWKFFNKMHTHKRGLMTINLTKSYHYNMYKSLNNMLTIGFNQKPSISKKVAPLTISYLKPIYILPFSFHNTTYNTIIFFILFRLTTLYAAPQNDFKLYYSYIFRPSNFTLYAFLNSFYFRVQHF